MVAITVLLILAVGGGASFAAESAVPGDVLYGVKTSVNENVRAALAVSTEAEAHWQANAAERRLDEAAKLEARGELDANVAAELGAAFAAHAEAALQAASELNTEGNAEAAAEVITRIDAAVKAHSSAETSANGGISASASLQNTIQNIGGTLRVSGGSSGDAVNARVGPSTVKNETSVHTEDGSEANATSNTKMEGSVKVELDL